MMPWKHSVVSASVVLASLVQPATPSSIVPENYVWKNQNTGVTFSFTILVLVMTTIWASRQLIADIYGVVAFCRHKRRQKKFVDVGAQTDQDDRALPALSRVWISPAGERYHVRATCGGLSDATRVTSRTPCLRCCL